MEHLRLGKLTGKETLEVTVEANSRIAGKPIKEMGLPERCCWSAPAGATG